MKYLFISLLLSVITHTYSQIPENYFKSPLKIPLVLSGTFGELRSNHFHSGLDIKTQGREGLNIHAAAKGFISRIKISHFGYGKAIYIQHPNGYTTVYAHLQKFSKNIEDYVKSKQYKKQTYAIELFPAKGEFPIIAEEVIALSGNSGGSGGPHLHFEIRDAQQRPMNPMLFGMDIKDTRKPIVNTLWLYPLDDDSEIEGARKPYRLKIKTLANGTLKTTPVTAYGSIGIAVSAMDQQNAANNKNGYYSIDTSINGSKNFEMEMKRFSFSETRYINRMIDFDYFKRNKSRITKLFIENNNPLSIYKNGNGYIDVKDSLSYNCMVTIKDIKENSKKIAIAITGKNKTVLETKTTHGSAHLGSPNEAFQYTNNYMYFSIPKGALYDYTPLQIEELPNDKIQIHNSKTPLHKYMTIGFDLSKVTNPKKSYIGQFYNSKSNRASYVGSKNSGTHLTARTRDFGNFGIFTDTIPPKVTPVNFTNKKWVSSLKTLRVIISDRDTGIKNFKATINGKFALMEYDYKRNLLKYNFKDGIHVSGKNDLKIYVEDNVGNYTIFDATFFRK